MACLMLAIVYMPVSMNKLIGHAIQIDTVDNNDTAIVR